MNSTPIPYVDLAAQHEPIAAELEAAFSSVVRSGQFILGPQVSEFERQFAGIIGATFAVGVASGTDALVLTLKALGIGPGDEVITVPNSFVASTSCIRLVGAKAVFVDVGSDFNINPDGIQSAIGPNTRAILPVHLTGRPCAMDRIMEIARKNRLAVIEDCAQSVLAEYQKQRVGSFGAAGCFSFHPLKTLNACGDAGAITTSDPQLYERLLVMRNLGLKTRDSCTMWATNSRLDSLQAAILLVKLRYLESWTEERRRNAQLYKRHLSGSRFVIIPEERENEKHVYHTFIIEAERRGDLSQYLNSIGIGTAVHYPIPIHLSAVGKELGYPEGTFPMCEKQAGRILSLPVYHGLTVEQIERVSNAIHDFYRG